MKGILLSAASTWLLAQVEVPPKAKAIPREDQFLLAILTLFLLAVLGAGVAVFLWARRWRMEMQDPVSIPVTLEDFQKLLEEGHLDAAEFERVRARLEGASEPPANSPAPQPPPSPSA